MATTQGVTPTCRYGHGELIRASVGNRVPEWAVLNPKPSPSAPSFLLALYVCPTCGYSEFFDLDPQETKNQEGVRQ